MRASKSRGPILTIGTNEQLLTIAVTPHSAFSTRLCHSPHSPARPGSAVWLFAGSLARDDGACKNAPRRESEWSRIVAFGPGALQGANRLLQPRHESLHPGVEH